MSQLPVLHTEPIDQPTGSRLERFLEVGEEIYNEIQKLRGEQPTSNEPQTDPQPKQNASPDRVKDYSYLTGAVILAVAGAMLTKRILF
jgi:hypothetical protein